MVALQQQFSDKDVLGEQDHFRLNQELQSGGDIFEIDSSSKAICLGPESDVSDLLVTFFDAQDPTRVGQVVISARTPFIGRLDALLATTIPSANTLARITVTVRDLVNNTFLPYGFDNSGPGPGPDFLAARVKPRIDLIEYFSDPSNLPAGRADRRYFFPFISSPVAPGASWYLLPYYGRRYAHVTLTNQNRTDNQPAGLVYNATVYGINFSAGSSQDNGGKWAQTQLGTLTAAENQTDNEIIRATVNGMFDMLAVRLAQDFGIYDPDSTLIVNVSDEE